MAMGMRNCMPVALADEDGLGMIVLGGCRDGVENGAARVLAQPAEVHTRDASYSPCGVHDTRPPLGESRKIVD